MKAIVLNAGQGRRLLPLTRHVPKCLLSVDGRRTLFDLQLDAIEECRISSVVVMLGFGAGRVERHLAEAGSRRLRVETHRNPYFSSADNLVTCWKAIPHMDGDFVLLNGDTLFEPRLLRRVLAAARGPVTVALDRKAAYDDDDMKVALSPDGRLRAVSKSLPRERVHAESIGMIVFRQEGVAAFRSQLEEAMRSEGASSKWYLSAVNALATRMPVSTVSVQGMWWTEVDSPEDLRRLRVRLRPPVMPESARSQRPLRASSRLAGPV